VHEAAHGPEVEAGALHRRRCDVGGVELADVEPGREGEPDRPRAAAQVDHDRPGGFCGSGDPDGRPVDEVLGAPPRHEDAGPHQDPQTGELRPAQELLEGLAGEPPGHQRLDQHGVVARRGQQPSLFLREDTSCCAEAVDE